MDSKGKTSVSHSVFVNKRTGKVASTNNWLLVLAAHAHINGDTSGIAGLLPQEQVKKLLVSNKLATRVARRAKKGRLTNNISVQARTLLPALAVMFIEQHREHKTITRKNFSAWLIKQLADGTSFASTKALHRGFEDLISNTTGKRPRSLRWWLDQIKKMQS